MVGKRIFAIMIDRMMIFINNAHNYADTWFDAMTPFSHCVSTRKGGVSAPETQAESGVFAFMAQVTRQIKCLNGQAAPDTSASLPHRARRMALVKRPCKSSVLSGKKV